MAGSEITFSTEQLDGVIDYGAWRRQVAALSGHRDEVSVVREAESLMDGSRAPDAPGPLGVVMGDAWDAAVTTISDVLEGGVQTASGAWWLGVADAIRSCSRLMALPDVGRGGATVRDVALALSAIVDAGLRAADPKLRYGAPLPASAREQRARCASIYIDLVCGRGVVWATAAELEAFCALAATGRPAAADAATYRMMRAGQLENRAKDSLRLEDPHGAMIAALMNALVMIDSRQNLLYETFAGGRAFDVAGCMRQESLSLCAPAIVEGSRALAFEGDGHSHGYATALDASPTDLVASLPRDYAEDMGRLYSSMLDDMAKEQARAGGTS